MSVDNQTLLRSHSLVGGTLASDVLHRLREDIISCVLKPGEKLRFEALRDIYGVSFSTLREALSRLASEQLVVAEGQRGFSVAPISEEDLHDVTDARVLIRILEEEAQRLNSPIFDALAAAVAEKIRGLGSSSSSCPTTSTWLEASAPGSRRPGAASGTSQASRKIKSRPGSQYCTQRC